jgi:terminal uridylyltransferase
VNGFSFSRSDLDISLTFNDHQTDDDLDSIDIIEQLADKLKKVYGIVNVQAITSAKVPIIKFTHFDTRLEGDISLYNILAQENTRMLRTYATIDQRVKILG